jgi:putative transposase
VTLRVRQHVWNLRSQHCFRVVTAALAASRERALMRVVHFSVQGNHLHMIAEAEDGGTLAEGMKGLQVRLAQALNRLMDRRGPVFADRYHAHVLRTPEEVRRAIAYVLENHDSHMRRIGVEAERGKPDPFSSAIEPGASACSPPMSWLLTSGSRRARPR